METTKDLVLEAVRSHGKINRAGLVKDFLARPTTCLRSIPHHEDIKRSLEILLQEGKIAKDPRFYFHDAAVYRPQSKGKRSVPRYSVPTDIETMFEQIVVTVGNLLADTKNAVEEVRRLRFENQALVEKIVQINSLLSGSEE